MMQVIYLFKEKKDIDKTYSYEKETIYNVNYSNRISFTSAVVFAYSIFNFQVKLRHKIVPSLGKH